MSNSLQKHGMHEAHKQLRLKMKNNGLDTVEVQVSRLAGKLQFNFTGSADQVAKAQKLLAEWS